jgi:poly-gamma-glutamate synthesis protein (capsule biosynthesis protein)
MSKSKHAGSVFNFFKRRFMTLSVLLSSGLLISLMPHQEAKYEAEQSSDSVIHTLTLVFAGDIMQHMPQVEAARSSDSNVFNYDTCFSYIKPWLSNADMAIANLETTLAGRPFSGYPAFSSPDALVNGMLNAGIDIAGTANNHCCDRGRRGIERTISVLDSAGMIHFGTYLNDNEYRSNNPKVITTKNFRLALVNYTYGTNGIPVPEGNIVSLIDQDRIIHDMKAAHDSMVDFTIVFIHWGEEYQRQPNAYQKMVARWLIDAGADIIIGSHPHVIQPMEWHKQNDSLPEKLIVWSLGNFVSNQRKQYTDGGTLVHITLEKSGKHKAIQNAEYQLTWVYNPIIEGKKLYYILPAAQYENDTLLIEPQYRSSIRQFLSDSRELLSGNLNVRERTK